ncbi:hypothetical protein HY949_04845 [Candidatus Gottesmanbacteria bacterium]|nr:hypothetical protein [Candidatus Gottesmanbacteria bacterium]
MQRHPILEKNIVFIFLEPGGMLIDGPEYRDDTYFSYTDDLQAPHFFRNVTSVDAGHSISVVEPGGTPRRVFQRLGPGARVEMYVSTDGAMLDDLETKFTDFLYNELNSDLRRQIIEGTAGAIVISRCTERE